MKARIRTRVREAGRRGQPPVGGARDQLFSGALATASYRYLESVDVSVRSRVILYGFRGPSGAIVGQFSGRAGAGLTLVSRLGVSLQPVNGLDAIFRFFKLCTASSAVYRLC